MFMAGDADVPGYSSSTGDNSMWFFSQFSAGF
jgi:hypothetical protein